MRSGTAQPSGRNVGEPVPVFAVFTGPAHILGWVSDGWVSRSGMEPPIGIPVREAWVDHVWKPVQQLMDEVYRTGVAQSIIIADGMVRIVPYPVGGPTRGVVSVHVRHQSPLLRSPVPRADLVPTAR